MIIEWKTLTALFKKFKRQRRTISLFVKTKGQYVLFLLIFILLILILFRNSSTDSSESLLNAGLLNLITEIFGALILIYFGVERILDQKEIDHLPGLPKRQIIRLYKQAKERIEILETFSMLAVEKWAEGFRQSILQAYSQGADIRIIILEPNSPGIFQRNMEIGKELPVLQLHKENLQCFHMIQQMIADLISREGPDSIKGSFSVRLVSALPSSTIYVVDNNLYHAPFPRTGRADISENLWFNIEDKQSIGSGYRDDFLRTWDDNTTPLPTLDQVTMVTLFEVGESQKDYHVYYIIEGAGSKIFIAWLDVDDKFRQLDYRRLTLDFDIRRQYEIALPKSLFRYKVQFEHLDSLALIERQNIIKKFKDKYGIEFEQLYVHHAPINISAKLYDSSGQRFPVYFIHLTDNDLFVAWFQDGDIILESNYNKLIMKSVQRIEIPEVSTSINCVLELISISDSKIREPIITAFQMKYGTNFDRSTVYRIRTIVDSHNDVQPIRGTDTHYPRKTL